MKSPDWISIVTEFSATRHTTTVSLWAANGLARFLECGSSTHLDEDILLQWLQEQLPRMTLDNLFRKLSYLKRFIHFLEEKALSPKGLFRQVWERPDLLVLLKGVRLYDTNSLQLDEHWQQTLAAFERSLRGYSPFLQADNLRIAGQFAAHLQSRGARCPDEGLLLEWVDKCLSSFRISTTAQKLFCLDHFCQFLVEKRNCPSNPLRKWRKLQSGLYDALQRRQQGKPPQLPPPRFQSFLARRIEAFLEHKRTLGRKYARFYALRLLDRHLAELRVDTFEGLTEKFFSSFLRVLFAHKKASARHVDIILLREFFHFLLRRGDISHEINPARFLPRSFSLSQPPRIFTLKEIEAILLWLRDRMKRPAFERQMFFTLFHLVYACGLRISEAIRLKVQDVDFQRETLFIRNTKFGKSRHIPLGQRASEYLHNYHRLRIQRLGLPRESAPFFVRDANQQASYSLLACSFRQACREKVVVPQAGSRPRIHDLRHSMAVHRLYKWYLEGDDPQERLQLLSLYMGHQQVTYTEHYLHLAQDLLRIAGRPLERPIEKWMQERQDHDED
jgi:site-specific recombinase XerD